MNSRVLRLFLFCFLAVSFPANAETPTLLGFPNPPLIEVVDGRATGPAAILASELAKAVGLDPAIEIQPLPRALITLEAGSRIIPLLTRTPGREDQYQWVAEIFVDPLAFHTLASNPRIDSVEAARALNAIALRQGSSSHQFLLANHFGTTIVEDPFVEYGARKLARGRVDAWFTSKTLGREVWRKEGLPADQLQAGNTVSHSAYWIAATKDVPPDLLKRMAEHFQQMKADGSYERIFAGIDPR